MRGCSRSSAIVVAIILVFTLVLVLFLFNFGRVITDREAIKIALKEEVLLDEATADLVRAELDNLPALQVLPPAIRESESLQGALDTLITSEWAAGQTEVVIDALFDYFETGDESELEIALDIGELLRSLRGETGRQLVVAVLEGLPTCSLDELPDIDLASGKIEISGCMPPFVPIDLVANSLHALLVNAIDEDTASAFVGDSIEINLLELDPQSRTEALASFQRVRQLYSVGRFTSWLLWLVPLACLGLIVILAVRSPGGFGHWLGWPLLVAAGIALVAAYLILPLLLNFGLDALVTSAPSEGSTPLAFRVLRVALEAMADIWLARVKLQSVLVLIAGLFLIALGFVGTWMYKGEPIQSKS
jgi:hypothetical protein